MSRGTTRRMYWVGVLAAASVWCGDAIGVTALGRPAEVVPVPLAMAAVGDSLSSGFPGTAANSWSTGTTLNSHAARMKALFPSLVTYNQAMAGAAVNSFVSQATTVATHAEVGYVTVGFGTNDICNPIGGVSTDEALFRQRFRAGLETLRDGLPGVKILVVSISNLESRRLAMVKAGRSGETVYCTRYFAKARSNAKNLVKKRARIMAEVRRLNQVMAEECALIVGCKTDDGAMFKHKWKSNEIGSDGGHLTKKGENMTARVTWDAGFTWVAAVG